MAEVIIERTPQAASARAARHIAATIAARPDLVLGVATGSTPAHLYRELARIRDRDGLDVSRLTVFALDEYVGLPAGHPESYAEVVRREVTDALGLDPSRVHVPDGSAADPFAAADEYEQRMEAAGGVDVQILGIGGNGHIGFNEPGSSLRSRTRVKTLSRSTRTANARFFDEVDRVPAHCITQGVGTILDAGHLVLLAFGAGKADAVAAALEGPVTASVPGSALQLHPHVTALLDDPAAAALAHREYYDDAWSLKPADVL
ncbi:glucosamine-6-phosphate deaminase [Agromyces tropicus]|uniref:Glucosamine-6-phosphate deaminase n=1 Tax=Agromyces tropicus TaxID=555371 RepID=A0ABN2UQZ2_9MICO